MRKIYLMICLCIFINITFAQQAIDFQTLMLAPNADFQKIQQLANQYYSTYSFDTEEGGSYSQYKRWEWFWETRTGIADQSNSSFQYALQALNQLVQEKICNTTNASSNWKILGPIQNSQGKSFPNMGYIKSVAVNPKDHNIIYAGSNTGGLWRTNIINTPIVWANITDGIGTPGLGIMDIVINPVDTNIIYIATGSLGAGGLGGGYGVGILKSTNSGKTWEQKNPSGFNSKKDNMVNRLIMDSDNSKKLYALIRDKVYKTIDGGNNWSDISPELPYSVGDNPFNPDGMARYFIDIEIMPGDHNVLFVSTNDELGAVTGLLNAKIVINNKLLINSKQSI